MDKYQLLEKLSELKDKGALSEDEYNAQKRLLLADQSPPKLPESGDDLEGQWWKAALVILGILFALGTLADVEPDSSGKDSTASSQTASRNELLRKLGNADARYQITGMIQIPEGRLVEAIGRPTQVERTGNEVTLIYSCTDGTVAITCDAATLQSSSLVFGRVDYW